MSGGSPSAETALSMISSKRRSAAPAQRCQHSIGRSPGARSRSKRQAQPRHLFLRIPAAVYPDDAVPEGALDPFVVGQGPGNVGFADPGHAVEDHGPPACSAVALSRSSGR